MTIEEINQYCQNSFISHLEIEFLEYGEDYVLAKMPVNIKKHQPAGVLHGGASLALAETVAGAGSTLLIDTDKQIALGLQVTGNHVSTTSSGEIFARATIIHKGMQTHIWDVIITDAQDKLISVVRVTNIINNKQFD